MDVKEHDSMAVLVPDIEFFQGHYFLAMSKGDVVQPLGWVNALRSAISLMGFHNSK